MIELKSQARFLGIAAATAIGLVFSSPATAWEPTEEVKIIAHAGTNSSTWAFANEIVKIIRDEKMLPHGASVQIVEGARGAKARAYVANDKAGDPHILNILTPSMINNPILVDSPVNYTKFRGIAMLLVTPKVLVVNADAPYQTMKDLMDDAKARPGELIQGGGQIGATASLINKIIEGDFGVDLIYTPFDDQGVLQLVGGHVDFLISTPEQVAKFVKSGDLRIIAASAKLSEFPDVPTFVESGYDFNVLDSYRGVWTSKDVPDDAAEFYVDLLDKVRSTEAFKTYMDRNQMLEMWITGADLDAFLKKDHETYLKIDTELDLIEKQS